MSILVFQIVTLAWLITEIVRAIVRKAAERRGDRTAGVAGGSWILFGVIGLSFFLANMSQLWSVPRLPLSLETRMWSGIIVVVLGVAVRWQAVRTLGRFFTMNVAIRTGHEIVERGLYRWVRHPSYSGLLLSCLGVGIGLGNWASVMLALGGPALVVLYRICIEERILCESFPEEYPAYMRRTKRLVPGVY